MSQIVLDKLLRNIHWKHPSRKKIREISVSKDSYKYLWEILRAKYPEPNSIPEEPQPGMHWFGFMIQQNDLIPEDKIVLMDSNQKVLAVIDLKEESKNVA